MESTPSTPPPDRSFTISSSATAFLLSNSLRCNNGHVVAQLKLSEHFYRGRTGLRPRKCELCGEKIPRKAPRWTCGHSFCSFYVCQDCYDTSLLKGANDADKINAEEQSARERAVSLLPVLANLAGQEGITDDSDDEDALKMVQSVVNVNEKAKTCVCFASCMPSWLSVSGTPNEKTEVEESSIVVVDTLGAGDVVASNSRRKATEMSSMMLDEGDSDDDDSASSQGRLDRSHTAELFSNISTAPAVGGIDIAEPHSQYLLPPEMVLHEPSEEEIFDDTGKRLIFLNTVLTQKEQESLRELHQVVKDSMQDLGGASGSAFPNYARLQALRILQQAKFDASKAVQIFFTHLTMRVKCFPLTDADMMSDLKKGLMYWHGRDRQFRPCLVWKMARMVDFTKETATRLVLFVLEYAIRFLLIPGRVETWTLLVDLEDVGLGHATSAFREIAKNISILLEQVYCGRNYHTKIFRLPWAIKTIANGFIPADKKKKVHFVGNSKIQEAMAEMFEPHQVEERYGGTAPNLEPHATYPFHFFPNADGKKSQIGGQDTSMHKFTDREFHEGFLLDDSSSEAKAEWISDIRKQSITERTAKELKTFGINDASACIDLKSWFQIVNPEAAKSR